MLHVAGIASGIAAAVTVLAFVAALVVDPPSDSNGATVALTSKANAAIAVACDKNSVADEFPGSIFAAAGSISPGDMEKEFVSVTLDEGTCGAEKTVVAVPRAQVRAVAFNR